MILNASSVPLCPLALQSGVDMPVVPGPVAIFIETDVPWFEVLGL